MIHAIPIVIVGLIGAANNYQEEEWRRVLFALTQTCRNDFRNMFLAAVTIQKVRRGYKERKDFAERHPDLCNKLDGLRGHMFRRGSILAAHVKVKANNNKVAEITIDTTGDGKVNASINRTISELGETWGADTTGDGKDNAKVIAIDTAGDGKADTLVIDMSGNGLVDTAIPLDNININNEPGRATNENDEVP